MEETRRTVPLAHRRPPIRWVARLVGAIAALAFGLVSVAQDAPAQPASGAVPAHRQASNVAIITINEEISSTTAFSFIRRLRAAEKGGADAIVVELNTPGGEVGAVIDICDAIRSSTITNSVAWIHPTAYSGGAIVAIACKEIVTAMPARMGDALPIRPDQMARFMSMEPAERQKVTAPLIAEVVGSARLRGWDEYVVQGFVALGVELWWVRDTQTGEQLAISEDEFRMLFDGAPPRTRPILAAAPYGGTPATPPADGAAGPPAPGQSEGQVQDDQAYKPASPGLAALEVEPVEIGQTSRRRTISPGDKGRYELVGYLTSGDGPIVLQADEMVLLGFAANVGATGALQPIQNDTDLTTFFGAKAVRRLDPTWSEGLVRVMTHPIARGVLFVVFLLAMFLEMSHPGIGLPAAVAAVTLVALLAPPALIGMASWWEIGAIVVGLLLIVLEIFVLPGFGLPGIAGLIALFGGLLGTFVGDTPGGLFPNTAEAQSDLLVGLVTVILSTVTAILCMYFLAKNFGSMPLIGGLVLKTVSGEAGEEDSLLAGIPVGGEVLPRVGATGAAISALRPSGRAQIGDRVIDVVADFGYIEAGRPVRVVSADEFRVVVEDAGQSA